MPPFVPVVARSGREIAGIGEFENAILCGFTASDDRIRAQAVQYCDQLKANPSCWQLCTQLFSHSAHPEVRFWSIQTLSELISRGALSGEMSHLQQWLLACITSALDHPVYLQNKLAQLAALMCKTMYPEQWPSFFVDFLSLLDRGECYVDFFVRLMRSVYEEIISIEFSRTPLDLQRATVVKDAIRVQCMGKIVDAWYNILSMCHSTRPELACACLGALQPYIAWMDIKLFIDERYLQMYFSCVGPSDLGLAVCSALNQVALKKMEAVPKVEFLSSIRIVEFVLHMSKDEPSEQLASLVNTVASALLVCVGDCEGKPSPAAEAAAAANTLLLHMMSVVFTMLSCEDDRVSEKIQPFIVLYLNSLKRVTHPSQVQQEHIVQLTRRLALKCKYDEAYSWSHEDEAEDEFQQFRKDLINHFKNIARMQPVLVKTIVGEMLQAALASIATVDYATLELPITLLYSLGEINTEQDFLKADDVFFAPMLTSLITSQASSFPHRAVAVAWLETVSRYSKFLEQHPALVPTVLSALCDQRGLRHAHAAVRSRAAYIFLRLVKTVRPLVLPYVDTVLAATTEFLTGLANAPSRSLLLDFDDRLHLFEVSGLLLGAELACERSQQYVQSIVAPHVACINELLSKSQPNSAVCDADSCTLLSQSIMAMGYLCKGFPAPTDDSSQPALLVYQSATEVVLKVLYYYPAEQELQKKVLFFFHRMVDCLGLAVLYFLPPAVSTLLPIVSTLLLCDLIQLIHQLMARFKAKMAPVMNELFMVVVNRVGSLLQPLLAHDAASTVLSEEMRELVDLERQFYQFMQGVVGNELFCILLSPENAAHINHIFTFMLQATVCSTQPSNQKLCFVVFSKLIDLWGKDPASRISGFDHYFVESVLPASFQICKQPSFNAADAQTTITLLEAMALHRAAASVFGDPFVIFLRDSLLPSLGCPAALSHQYCEQLSISKPDQRAAKDVLQRLVQQLRLSTS